MSKLVIYASDQAHSSVEKAARISVLRLRKIETHDSDDHALRGNSLENAIKDDIRNGMIPCFVSFFHRNLF